ncbi:MAG: pyruvate carboxylase subunit B, partial [candidate division WOR-3 bacterium]|nr:pyruvate carboxylase subunit B [candidate division WOR-3 bacterium]
MLDKPVSIIDTTFRDAHQSLMATRMRTEDMLPICDKMDKLGFYAMEVWGGATFDVCIRYLNEDPWERLRLLRAHLPNTKLLMLLRGQNIVGYRNYPDDVLEAFIKLAKKNGIDIFRIFDALNDIRNLEKAIKFAKDNDALVQGTICYTTSPVHTIEKFVDYALELEKLGCDSICIKDMA